MNNNFLENVFLTTRHWLSGRRDTGTAHHPVTTVNDFGELSPEQRRRLSVVESEDVFSSYQWFELLSLTTFCTEPLTAQFIYLLDTATDERYVTTAWGRDYSDVAPMKGVVFSGGAHQLTVSVDVARV